MDDHALQDFGVTAQMGPPHPAGVVQMRGGAFQILAPPTQWSFAAPPSLRFRDRTDRRRKKKGANDEVDGVLGFVSQMRPPVFHSPANRPARKDW